MANAVMPWSKTDEERAAILAAFGEVGSLTQTARMMRVARPTVSRVLEENGIFCGEDYEDRREAVRIARALSGWPKAKDACTPNHAAAVTRLKEMASGSGDVTVVESLRFLAQLYYAHPYRHNGV